MPELPEVETARRGLAPVMEGARFLDVEVRQPRLRWPLPKDFAKRLKGQTVTGLGRRAKYLLADLSSGDVLLMHLGMSGSFRVSRHPEVAAKRPSKDDGQRAGRRPSRLASLAPQDDGEKLAAYYRERSKNEAHDHVVFHMSSGATIRFNDPRRFGSMKIVLRARLDEEPLLKALGPEPLGNEFSAEMLARACKGKKTSLKAALSDQRIVAGLGNIYVCEALHRAHLSPKKKASSLADRKGQPTQAAKKLVAAIRAVLNDAIVAGGSSLRDHRRTDGSLGDFQHDFRVYDREGEKCRTPGCGGVIKRIVQTGRATFFCPKCQK